MRWDRPALVGIVTLLIVSAVLERYLLVSPETEWPTLIGLMVAAGAVAAWLLVATSPTVVPPKVRSTAATVAFSPLVAGVTVAAIACAVISARLVTRNEWAAQWLWLAGMALAVAGPATQVARDFRVRSGYAPELDQRLLGTGAALSVLSLAVRLPQLTSNPPFVHPDEATCGLVARLFADGRFSLLHLPVWGLPAFSFAPSAAALRLFGDDLFGLRMASVLTGTVGVVLAYLLGREWFGDRAGALGGALLAMGFVHADVSRNGIHYIQGPTCITLTVFLATLWLKRGNPVYALLAADACSLDLQMYFSARAAIVPLAVLGACVLIQQWETVRRRWSDGLWLVVGLFVSLAPIVALFAANPGTFNGHQAGVSVLNQSPATAAHFMSQYGTSALIPVLRVQLWRTITTFGVRADTSLQIGWDGSMFDWLTAALLPAAVLLAVLQWKRWPNAVCLAWFAAGVGAVALTLDPPWWPRLTAMLPAAALLVGVLLDTAWRVAERVLCTKIVPAVAVGAVLVLIGITNLKTLFMDYPGYVRQGSPMEPTLVGKFLAGQPGAAHTAMISDGSLTLTHDSIRFLAPHADGCTILAGEPWNTCHVLKDTQVFVLVPELTTTLRRLRAEYPAGQTVEIGTYYGGAVRLAAYVRAAAPGGVPSR